MANEKYTSSRFRWSEFEDFFDGFKETLNDPEHLHLTNVLREAFERKFKERCKVDNGEINKNRTEHGIYW